MVPFRKEGDMVWYGIVIVAAIALAAGFVRFVRTPSFRHRFGSEGKDPGQAGAHPGAAC